LTWLAALGRIFTNIDTDQLERFQVQAMSDFEKLLELKRDDGRSILPASILVEIAVSSLFAIQDRDKLLGILGPGPCRTIRTVQSTVGLNFDCTDF